MTAETDTATPAADAAPSYFEVFHNTDGVLHDLAGLTDALACIVTEASCMAHERREAAQIHALVNTIREAVSANRVGAMA